MIKTNELSDKERAQSVVIVARLISVLAGAEESNDQCVTGVINEIVDLCCRSKMKSSFEVGRELFYEAIDSIDQEQWLFTARKMTDGILLEAKIGQEIETAKLAKSVTAVAEAGRN